MRISMILIKQVLFLLWICQVTCLSQNGSAHSSRPNASKISHQNVKPHENRLKIKLSSKNRKYLETPTPPDVMDAINTKINELKSYFQDSVNLLDDQPEKEEEATTIIEFSPSVLTPNVLKSRNDVNIPFDKHIRKYQKMRDKIKVRLEKETVSSKTQKLIIKTIDEMIAKLVSGRCDWNQKQQQILRLAEKRGVCKFNNMTLTGDECKSIVLQYFAVANSLNDTKSSKSGMNFSNDFHRTADELKNFFKALWQNESLMFLQKFTNTISDVMNDAQSLSDKYKVKCSLVEINSDVTRRINCDNFKLCTDEFRAYLSEFYKHLNDTTVSVFRNYAAMYVRDVNSDAIDEKSSVIKTINALSDVVEKRVQDGFIKYTRKISLSDNKESNMKIMKEYIKATTRYLKKHIKKHMEGDLSNLKATLHLTITQDIKINLDVDLGNLESNFLGRMCTFFVTCNGEVGLPPRKGFNSTTTNLDPQSVFVKVELTLDDDLKGSIERTIKHNNLRRANIVKKNFYTDSSNKILATRTTLAIANTTAPVTKIYLK